MDLQANDASASITRRAFVEMGGQHSQVHGDELVLVTSDNDSRTVVAIHATIAREYFVVRKAQGLTFCPYGMRLNMTIGARVQCH